MASSGASSSDQLASAPIEPYVPLPPPASLLSSYARDLLSKATVILCSREDIFLFLTTPPTQHDTACPIPTAARSANPSPESLIITEDNDDAMSDTTHSSLASLASMGDKIPKPDGEPGRPGRGGYNLESQLAWDSTTFLRLKKFVHRSIKKHLDTTKCKSFQNKEAIRLVTQEALDEFQDLKDYAACWPVKDLIQMRLKYTSRRARLSQRKGAANMSGKKGQLVS